MPYLAGVLLSGNEGERVTLYREAILLGLRGQLYPLEYE